MPISSNNSHITFNNNSTQNTAFLGSIAAANITGTITGPQIAPGTITAPNIAPGVIPSGGLSGQVFVSTTPGPGAWTAPPTTTRIKVTVVGGGGGAAAPTPVGAGGGGGGAAVRSIPVVGGTPYPYTIGAGGTGGGPPGNGGAVGGTTSFGSPALVSATGGTGSPPNCGVIAGGTGSSGDINITGGGGGWLTIGGSTPSNPCVPPSPFNQSFGGGDSYIASRKTTPGTGHPFGGGGVGPAANSPGGPGGIIIEF